LTDQPLGWVTKAYHEPDRNALIFGFHRPHQLTELVRFDLKSKTYRKIGSLPSPSMVGIASTAFDRSNRLLFYTTNNNKLFRDIHVLSTASGENKLLFPDCRVGHISVSEKTHELYGIRHEDGKTELVYSAYPYKNLIPIVNFGFHNNLQHLAISPDGQWLAATLHRNNGEQAVILSDLQSLKAGHNFTYKVIAGEGSPEHPSWDETGRFIYYNAYVNGVSNIYRYHLPSDHNVVLSHTIRGLFQPIVIHGDSIMAFEFTASGFRPVVIADEPARQLPAIEYYGQKVLQKNPEIRSWPLHLNSPNPSDAGNDFSNNTYSALQNMHVHSIIPVLTGFQSQKAIGIYTHIADPLYIHDISIEMGYTPYNPAGPVPRFHFKGIYEYRRRLKIGVRHNAPNFFDLFNDRKRSMIGDKYTLTHTKFWKYDIPHKIKQTSEAALYTGVKAINDNLVLVSRPDFLVMQSGITSAKLRRSIGSVDSEKGTELALNGMFFAVEPQKGANIVGGVHAEAGYYLPAFWSHNVLHSKISAGYRHINEDMAIGRFYFGGFGNRRYLDDGKIKQYRKVFRFPGIPIYSLSTDRFVKGLLEHNLPPWRPGNIHLGHHYLSYINSSWYVQGLRLKSPRSDTWLSLGAQINFNFKHWYNLETTLSFGAARAWWGNQFNDEWFVSLKLFKD
ncbi:MAG: hypothetical protein GF313_09745, partial [Caldithrix sp.]|nr:hypothetical protein [Caldithrix sp.]